MCVSGIPAQIEGGILEHLQRVWLDGALAALREERKKYDKRCAEHEAARVKYLALKKLTKRDVLEKSFGELAASRVAADEARFDLARRLNEVMIVMR